MLGNFDLAVEGLGCYCISSTQPVKHQRCTSVLNPRRQIVPLRRAAMGIVQAAQGFRQRHFHPRQNGHPFDLSYSVRSWMMSQ